MESKLVIIGASGLGREVYSIAVAAGFRVRGFLDSRSDILDGMPGYPGILSSPEDYSVAVDDVFVCAVGEPQARRKYVEMIKARGGRFVSVVHPSVACGCNVIFGCGCIVRQFAVIGSDAVIGEHVQIGPHVTISHDCQIGDYVSVSPGSNIAGWCHIGEGCFLGVHSAVVPRVVLGGGVFVAAGAVVTGSFDSGRLMGVPARVKSRSMLSGAIVGEWSELAK